MTSWVDTEEMPRAKRQIQNFLFLIDPLCSHSTLLLHKQQDNNGKEKMQSGGYAFSMSSSRSHNK
jgi:hypothetical protein